MKNLKNKLNMENLICIYVILNPVLDIISFLFRNYFKIEISPSTIIRPIIPIILYTMLFFKEKNKKIKIITVILYFLYAIIHLILFNKLHNECSYGNILNELQYILNYSLLIFNIYIFFKVIKEKNKLEKAVYISLLIYIITIFISIITKTYSYTYIEKIGFKGYFESGNSLCTVLILSICVILPNNELSNWKKFLIVFITGLYLALLSGMRTGLFGFSLTIGIYIFSKFLLNIRDKIKFTKKQILITTIGIILMVCLLFIFGSKTFERRNLLKQNELENIDEETLNKRYVTGDILEIYKKIQRDELPEEYISKEEKNAIIKLCKTAEKLKLPSTNLRIQQIIYNIYLIKEQKNIFLILFGNGYKNQIGELVLESETISLFLNFGVIGFTLYFMPVVYLFIKSLKIKKINIKYIMYVLGEFMAFVLSTFSGYVFFNISSMTIAIVLNILLNSLSEENCLRKEL